MTASLAGAFPRTPRTAPPDLRLYGRRRFHALRVRQQTLLNVTFPRLRYDHAAAWAGGFDELWLEIGYGGGEHTRALVAAHPTAALIGCEVFVNGICSLLGHLVPPGEEGTAPLPANLRLWDGDARALLTVLPDACLDRLFLMFPDPWPKNRHADRRFVGAANITLAGRVIKPGGIWRIASDDPVYQAWVDSCLSAQSLFAASVADYDRPQGWPPTRYEAKALRAGRRPVYWTLVRRPGTG